MSLLYFKRTVAARLVGSVCGWWRISAEHAGCGVRYAHPAILPHLMVGSSTPISRYRYATIINLQSGPSLLVVAKARR
jgi:hypothetical protein